MTKPSLPPTVRSRTARGLLRGVAAGKLVLQECAECGTVQYPPREACRSCLGADLPWRSVKSCGRILATTTVRVSNEEYFRERVPWPVALVHADCGPRIITHAPPDVLAGQHVRVTPTADPSGSPALVSVPTATAPGCSLPDTPAGFSDRVDGNTVLVTDTESVLGRHIVDALWKRGAAQVVSASPDGDPAGTGHRNADLILDTR